MCSHVHTRWQEAAGVRIHLSHVLGVVEHFGLALAQDLPLYRLLYPDALVFKDPRFHSEVWLQWETLVVTKFGRGFIAKEKVKEYHHLHGRPMVGHDYEGMARNIAHCKSLQAQSQALLSDVTMPLEVAGQLQNSHMQAQTLAQDVPSQQLLQTMLLPVRGVAAVSTHRNTGVHMVECKLHCDTGVPVYPELLPMIGDIQKHMNINGWNQAVVAFFHGTESTVGWFERIKKFGPMGRAMHQKLDNRYQKRWSELQSM